MKVKAFLKMYREHGIDSITLSTVPGLDIIDVTISKDDYHTRKTISFTDVESTKFDWLEKTIPHLIIELNEYRRRKNDNNYKARRC